MAAAEHESDQARPDWRRAIARSDLGENGVALARIGGRQIAVFETGQGIRACDNRCPHEGYPLTEGSLSPDCSTVTRTKREAQGGWRTEPRGGFAGRAPAVPTQSR